MKTWEMYKYAEDYPGAKFRSHKRQDNVYFFNNEGSLVAGEPVVFVAVSPNMNEEWELIREPVTWQEAIQAWVDGKTISCKHTGMDEKRVYKSDSFLRDQFRDSPCKKEFTDGKWYIDD